MSYNPKTYRKQGGDELVVASGGKVTVESGGVLDASGAAAADIKFPAGAIEAADLAANLKTGRIQLSLFTARIIAANAIQNTTEAGVPDGNTAGPSIARVNGATDKAGRLIWAANEVNEIQFEPFAYPPDLDDTAAVTVCVLAAMSGATDTPALTVAYFEGVGDTDAGGVTGAVTGTTVAKYTRAIAAGDIGAYPKAATITLTPAAHANDAIHVYAAWCEYTRKS